MLLFLSLYVFGYLLPLLLLHPNYTAYVDQSNDSQSAVDKIFYIHSPDEGGSLSNPPGKGEPINSLMDGIFGRERIDKVRIENPERTYNGDAARLRAGDLAKGLRLHLDQKKTAEQFADITAQVYTDLRNSVVALDGKVQIKSMEQRVYTPGPGIKGDITPGRYNYENPPY